MAKKRIKAFGEWVEDHLRRACGALSPDKRIIVILTLLLFFSVLSLYFTVSSIYRFGKGAGEPLTCCSGFNKCSRSTVNFIASR